MIVAAFETAKTPGAALHLMGLLSDGGVHSSNEHLYALVDAAVAGRGAACHGALLHGRPRRSAVQRRGYMRAVAGTCRVEGPGRRALRDCHASSGRYYAMDRDKRWERVRRRTRPSSAPSRCRDRPSVDRYAGLLRLPR